MFEKKEDGTLSVTEHVGLHNGSRKLSGKHQLRKGARKGYEGTSKL